MRTRLGRARRLVVAWLIGVGAFAVVVLAVPGHCPREVGVAAYQPVDVFHEAQHWQWAPPGRYCTVRGGVTEIRPGEEVLTAVRGDRFGGPGWWEWPVLAVLLAWPFLLVVRQRRASRDSA